ncbi:MAG: group II intron reverse transcriptase/maturase [Thermoplasmata archaeon]|nr:group II intron reverse transcriptase/maturase [Thermoplasmata archaeon]
MECPNGGSGKGRTPVCNPPRVEGGTMTSQRKRLQSYLKERGLEVHIPDGAEAVVLQNTWGELNIPDLMDKVLDKENFNQAVQRVVANGGAPGVDGMSAEELPTFVEEHWNEIYTSLRAGRYKPSPVRRVTIPKPDGGERNLGVPTVLDRAVQQAVAQVLTPVYEPIFSESSFGFRPNRSAHQAITRLLDYYKSGYTSAVDLDLSKYFDTLNHELLMNIIRRDIRDETLLVTIKRFLKSGVLVNGVVQETEKGSPQGGPLSPLLANIYLNEFDRLLEERGLRFCRYADDIVILVRSERAAKRVMESTVRYLEGNLKLKVNTDKSMVAKATDIKFLGFTVCDYENRNGQRIIGIMIHRKSTERFRDKVRKYLRENSDWTVQQSIAVLTSYYRGWLSYFAIADTKWQFTSLGEWTRRKLRAKMWYQKKTPRNRRKWLRSLSTNDRSVYGILKHARAHGSWHMSAFRPLQSILSNRYLESIGFPPMLEMYEDAHARLTNRRIREVRTVV